MSDDRTYQDSDGFALTLWQMCHREPEWAKSRILEGERALEELVAAQARALAAETQQTVLEEACERLSLHLSEVTAERDSYRAAWERDGKALHASTDALMRAHAASRHTMPDPDDSAAWPLPRADLRWAGGHYGSPWWVWQPCTNTNAKTMGFEADGTIDGGLTRDPDAPEIERVLRAREAARRAKHGGAK